jgi:hypothetical protein
VWSERVPVWSDLFRKVIGGGEDELSRDNLTRWVVDGLVGLRTRAARGTSELPPEVRVTIQVAEGSVEVIKRFVTDPAFDDEVNRRLLNRLVDVPADAHPLRHYVVQAGESNAVTVAEAPDSGSLELVIRGGDRDGDVEKVPAARRDLAVGRGPTHGERDAAPNDLVVCRETPWVSRRAARLRRIGGSLRVHSLDQGDCLVVVRPDGERVRPSRTVERWTLVRPGDRIELNDGGEQVIALELVRIDEVSP